MYIVNNNLTNYSTSLFIDNNTNFDSNSDFTLGFNDLFLKNFNNISIDSQIYVMTQPTGFVLQNNSFILASILNITLSEIDDNTFSFNNYRPGSNLSFLFLDYTYNNSKNISTYNSTISTDNQLFEQIFGNNLTILTTTENNITTLQNFNQSNLSFNFYNITLQINNLSSQNIQFGNLNCSITPRNCSYGENMIQYSPTVCEICGNYTYSSGFYGCNTPTYGMGVCLGGSGAGYNNFSV